MVRPTLAVLGCGLLLIAAGLGCGPKKKSPAPVRPAALTVQSVGAAPRRRLRYHFGVGEKLAYRMISRRKISGLLSATGPVSLLLSVRTERIRGRRALLRWRVEHVDSGAQRLRGRELWVDTSDRGEITTVSRGRPRPAPPAQLHQSVRLLYLAWPNEAVGPGARWIQRRDLILAASTQGGFRAKVVARYSFDRVAPCGQGRCAHLSLRMALKLSHRAGKVKVKGEGTGTGRVVFDLQRGRLQESHIQAVIGLSTSIAPGKVLQKITLVQSMTLTR